MAMNLSNFLISKKEKSKMADFQDLDHLDGLSISVTSANLYKHNRDDLVMFYFRNGAEHASVYTKSSVISENIKWNKNIKNNRVKALIVNARNANCLTGPKGYNSLKQIAELTSGHLTEKQKLDEDKPQKVKSNEILFGCTGTIGEVFPLEKIRSSIKTLVDKIKYTQNKYLWIKAAMSIITTDLKAKSAMEECKIKYDYLSNEANEIAFRITPVKILKELIVKINAPLISTSANISGKPFAKTIDEISPSIFNSVDVILNFEILSTGKPSSIIKINNNQIEYLRR
jgi:glutamate N-acetyltransferase/amino-acid N-acetyltransferase